MKFFYTLILILLFCSTSQADLGSTVVYKAKFVLKNGSSFIGYLPISGYDESLDSTRRNKHCSDKAFQLMLIKNFSPNTIYKDFQVYDCIHLVHIGQNDRGFNIGCVDKTKIKTLQVQNIKYTVFLDAAYANYDWHVYGIQEMSPSVINIISHQNPVNYEELLFNKDGYDTGDYACFINFNPDISSSELYRLVAELSRKIQIGRNGNKIITPSQVKLLLAKHIFIFYGYVGPC